MEESKLVLFTGPGKCDTVRYWHVDQVAKTINLRELDVPAGYWWKFENSKPMIVRKATELEFLLYGIQI